MVQYESLETLRSSLDAQRPSTYTDDGIISCPYDVDYVLDQNDQQQIFGRGAWSCVFKATCQAPTISSYGLLTPPSGLTTAIPLVVAVKTPTHKAAISILRNEAKTLSRLREADPREACVATFHGIIDKTSSIVMNAYPTSLEDYIRAKTADAPNSTSGTDGPVPMVGSALVWLDLAMKLVTSLEWMHNSAKIVHGDIKPGNIVLRSTACTTSEEFPLDPLFIDFSSSQQLDTAEITENTLSAVTTVYTAPELLTSAVMSNPKSCATTASDVFSLAVTLLVAATGDVSVYPGCQQSQKLMYATQGNFVLNNIQAFSNRAPRHGVVSRALERAVLKKDSGRIHTKTWKERLTNLKQDIVG